MTFERNDHVEMLIDTETVARGCGVVIEVWEEECRVELYDVHGMTQEVLIMSQEDMRLEHVQRALPPDYPDTSNRGAVAAYIREQLKKRYPERAAREAAAAQLEAISQLIKTALFEDDEED